MSASDAIQLAFTQTWQIALLVLIVCFVSKTIARKSVHFAYVLWLVVLIKCLVPPILSSPAGLFCWIDFSVAERDSIEDERPLQMTHLGHNEFATVGHPLRTDAARTEIDERSLQTTAYTIDDTRVRESSLPLESDAPGNRLASLGLLGWLIGAVVVFSLMLVRTGLCFYRIRSAGLNENESLSNLVSELRHDLNLKRPVRILITECRIGPLVYGLFRPTILIPRLILQRSSKEDLVPILTHELIHVRRGDLWINLVQILTNAVWWFNPLVWLANRNVSRVAESCCDEQTVASLGCGAKTYAESLLRILELKRSLSSVPAFPGIRPVEITSKRLEKIMKLRQGCHKRTPKWCWAAMIAMMLVSLPGALSVLADDPKSESKAEQLLSPRSLSAETIPPFNSQEFLKFEPGTPQIAIETRFATLPEEPSKSFRIDWSFLQVPAKTVVDRTKKRDVSTAKRKSPRHPQGRSQTVIETNEPVKYAILTPEETEWLLKSPKANLLQAPKVTLFDRQIASISDSTQRPFVVGYRNDDHQLQVVSEGTVIDCQPEALEDGAVWLDLTATYSEIREVRESTITKPESFEKITVQIPEVKRTAIGVQLEIPANQTLVLAGTKKLNAKEQVEQLLIIIRPEVLPSDQLNAKQESKASENEPVGSPGKLWDLSLVDCIHLAMQNSRAIRSSSQVRGQSGNDTTLFIADPNLSVHDVEGTARNLLSEIIKSYWELYFYYHNLDAAKTGRDQALVTWRELNAKPQTATEKNAAASIAQAQEHYFFFRGRAEEAKRDLIKAERQLRFLMGLAVDERTIRPSSKPTEEKMDIDWEEAKNEVLQNSIEIKRQTKRIAEQKKELEQLWHRLKPQIDTLDLYSYLGLDDKTPNTDFASTKFARIVTDKMARNPGKSLGMVMSLPIGLRSQLSSIRQKQLELDRSKAIKEDLELELSHSLHDAVQNVQCSHKLMETTAMQVLSSTQQVLALQVQRENGSKTLDFLFDAQRRLADARVAYFQSVLQYNRSIVEVHYRKGTLLSEYKYKVAAASNTEKTK